MSAFKNMQIKHRILALVVISLFALGSISFASIFTMRVIGDELSDIAERNIPLTEALQDITIHQLEQAVITERIIGVIEVDRAGGEPIDSADKLLQEFIKLGKKIELEIKDAEERSAAAQIDAHDEATRQEFVLVLNELKEIEAVHAAFDKHVVELAEMADSGASLDELHNLEKKIKEEEDNLDHSLTELLHELASFSERAGLKALHDERNGMIITIVISIGAFLALIVSAVLITSSIVGPIRIATTGFKAISDGDLSVEPKASMFNDEINLMNSAIETFRQQSISRVERERNEELGREKRAQKQSEMNQLVGIFGASIGGIFELVSESSSDMNRQSKTMANDAMTTRTMTDELLGMSETTSENAQQVSAATEQMVASIKEIATKADATSRIADEALSVATRSAEEVRELKEAADKIGTVVNMINDIAEQTNLLALNATIEAARAGDAGKGFAVVANEVKALATQTANATAEIADQIQGIQTASGHAADNITGIGDVIGKLNALSSAISAAITQQEATTQEIAVNISSVAEISQQVNGQLEEVRARAQNSESAATNVGSSSGQLEKEAISLGGEVETFLTALRNVADEDQSTFVAAKPVNLEASVQMQNGTRNGLVKEISPSHVFFTPAINAQPGTQTTVVIGDWGETISARVSETNDHGTFLQLPLNHEHIASMQKKLESLNTA